MAPTSGPHKPDILSPTPERSTARHVQKGPKKGLLVAMIMVTSIPTHCDDEVSRDSRIPSSDWLSTASGDSPISLPWGRCRTALALTCSCPACYQSSLALSVPRTVTSGGFPSPPTPYPTALPKPELLALCTKSAWRRPIIVSHSPPRVGTEERDCVYDIAKTWGPGYSLAQGRGGGCVGVCRHIGFRIH